MFEQIVHNQHLLALIVSHKFRESGIHFFTDDDLSQQLAYMQHPKGKVIEPHVHNSVCREVHFTQEALFIRKGKLRVDFYSKEQEYIESRTSANPGIKSIITCKRIISMVADISFH